MVPLQSGFRVVDLGGLSTRANQFVSSQGCCPRGTAFCFSSPCHQKGRKKCLFCNFL